MNTCPNAPSLVHALVSGDMDTAVGEHMQTCTSCAELLAAVQSHMATLSRDKELDDCDEAEVILAEADEGMCEPEQLAALGLHLRVCSLCYQQLALLEGKDEAVPRPPSVDASDQDLFVLRDSERFEIKKSLGSGGMGVVYEAYDHKHKVIVALKTLRDLRPQALYRLKNEFRARQDLQHPNLVNLGELIEQDGQWFFTMELVHGADFLRYVRPRHNAPRSQDATEQWQTDETVDELPATPSGRYQLVEERVTPMPVSPARDSGAGFDDARLRSALGQLCLALRALHDAGKVHRDVKPANILITEAGRLVLLDFGLIVDMEPEHAASDTAGTPAYMAPEQAEGKQVGPAADLYSVGVLLYQALTGKLPFPRDQVERLLNRAGRVPASPRTLVPEIPADLDALCMNLLAPDPAARPALGDVLARLGGGLHGQDATQSAWEATTTQSGTVHICVGRERETAVLEDAFAQVAAGATITVLIHGEPGIGKSALIQRFRSWLRRPEAGDRAVVLTGRCYERESVPYKAFDKAIDALSRWLSRLEPGEAAELMPAGAAVLGRVFPVLQRLTALARPAASIAGELTPDELRARMFTALRALLINIARRVPLVILIDDLHWADADSLALIGAISRPPDAPRLLLLATIRDSADAPVGPLAEHIPTEVRTLALGRLDHDAAVELAGILLSQHNLDYPPSASALARESGGHPLFIYELTRGAALSETTGARFEKALWSRIETLDAAARRLLEITVVANAPMPQGTLGRAAGIDASALGRHVDDLRAANLIRAASRPGWLEPYHERVSSTVLAHLHDQDKRSCHERLAWALEAAGVESDDRPDSEPLAVHWRGAGNLARASRYAIRAAAQAMGAQAFERAARLYAMALDMTPASDPGRHTLLASRGLALASAERCSEAAAAYTLAGSDICDKHPEQVLDYRLRAAENFLATSQADLGLAALHALLADLGGQRARSGILQAAQRIGLELRGFGVRARPIQDIAPEHLARLDTGFAACLVLAMAEPGELKDCLAGHLRAAVDAGEPARVARALALDAAQRALYGKPRRIGAILDQAGDAAGQAGTTHERGLVAAIRGLAALCRGAWQTAHELGIEAERALSEAGGLTLARGLTQVTQIRSLFYLGRWGEMARLVRRMVREVDAEADRTWYMNLHLHSGLGNIIWLAAGDVYTARQTRDSASRRWASCEHVLIQHVEDLLARHHIDLYTGDGRAAWTDINTIWPALERSGFLQFPLLRIECTAARARSALAATAAGQREFVDICARDIEQLADEKLPHAAALADLLRAGMATRQSDQDSAVTHLRHAWRRFKDTDMLLHAAVSRRCLGTIVGGEKGRKLRLGADRWMRSQGIANPASITTMLAPM